MRKRLVLLYIALVLIVAGSLSWSVWHSATRLYREGVETRLLDHAIWLGEVLFANPPPGASPTEKAPAIPTREPGAYDLLVRGYAGRMAAGHITEQSAQTQGERLRITIIREDGVVIGDSETDSRSMENHANRPEVVAARQNGTGTDERMSTTIGTPFLYLSRWFPEAGVHVRMALPLHALRDISSEIFRTALIGILVSLLLTAVLARLFSRLVTAPVVRLSNQLERMDDQHASLRLAQPSDRELGPLTRNVNELAERLEQSVLALRDRNAKVDTIISSLQTGLVAVDLDMRVMMVNPVIFGMFGIRRPEEVLGRPLVEVFRNQTLAGMLESAVRAEKSGRQEIQLYDGGKRMLDISTCPILPMEGTGERFGAIAHVADVTGVRRLEEIRSQFVSNVTHELKTPLTSIRGFVETLRAGALREEAVAARFLEIIDIEVDRLSGLIDDILSLSEIEGMRTEALRERVPLAPVVEDVLHMLAAKASERGVTLHAATGLEPAVFANRNRVKQLLLNLVDNGIKYNREGGRVEVSAHPRPDGWVAVHVADTGIGIPEEFRERVFERFYRVDRGRSRAQGGTGLGLSIVKHIAQLYGGTVELVSEPGKGSTFTVLLPTLETQPQQVEAETDTQPKAESGTQPQPEAETDTQPKAESGTQPQQVEAETDTQPETK